MGHSRTMLVRLAHSLYRVLVLAALTVALVGTGFAHRLAAPQDAALAYAVANGLMLADICGGSDGGSSHRASKDCQACRIAGSAALAPRTGVGIHLGLAVAAAGMTPVDVCRIVRRADPAHRPQGPPVG